MATFNSNILQEYYDSNNYGEAIKYIQQFKTKDSQTAVILNKEIDKLKILDAKQKSMISSANKEDKEAYFFMQAIAGNGIIPRNVDKFRKDANGNVSFVEHQRNSIGQEYTDFLNNTVTNDGKKINKIAFEIKDEDFLTSIAANLNIDDINNNNLGINVTTLSNGNKQLEIGLDNHNLYKIVDSINKTKDVTTLEMINRMIIGAATGMGVGAAVGTAVPGVGNIVGGTVGTGIGMAGGLMSGIEKQLNNNSRIEIKGIDSNNNIRNKNEFNYNNIIDAVNLTLDAEKRYNDLLKKHESEVEQVYSNIETTGYISPKHQLANEYLRRGLISLENYDKVTKILDDRYDKMFDNADFSQYECYAWNFEEDGDNEVKEGVNLAKIDNEKIPDLQARIKAAKAEDRVTYTFAQADGDLGTLVTIKPKADKDVWSTNKDKQEIRVFIKGLFTEEAQVQAEQSTNFKATKLNSDMKKYNYELNLDSGITVGRDKEIGAYTTVLDENNIPQRVPINDEQMLGYLNEHYIMQDAVNNAILYNNGKGGLDIPDANGKTTTTSIDDYCNTIAKATTDELFANIPSDDITRYSYQHNFYLRLRKLINSYYSNKIN